MEGGETEALLVDFGVSAFMPNLGDTSQRGRRSYSGPLTRSPTFQQILREHDAQSRPIARVMTPPLPSICTHRRICKSVQLFWIEEGAGLLLCTRSLVWQWIFKVI